jgi:hypothetical protein
MLDFDQQDIYSLVLEVCEECSVDPSSSMATEEFFRELLTQYSGAKNTSSVAEWLRVQTLTHFAALGERPRWLQGPDWPVVDGKPMIFVGQLDVSAPSREDAGSLFHDDTSLYVFVANTGPPVVVVQQL